MNWNEFHEAERQKDYYNNLYDFVSLEYTNYACYPPFDKILDAMRLTPFENVKCVILGQDPYPGEGQAMGLSFSVPDGIPTPKSLQNIYKELQNELGCYIPNNGNLTYWAEQGVLLLNSVLSVRAGQAASHADQGWERYTDGMIHALNQKPGPIVYMLWGSYARSKKSLITNPEALILECPHPSPLSASRGFFGCGHFKKCNEYLISRNVTPIDWQIKNV